MRRWTVPEDVGSPCTKKCSVNESNICPSCLRTMEEIVAWPDADAATRKKILARVKQRKQEEKDAGKQ